MIYPWQFLSWQYLCRAYQQQRMPHAILFTGNAGIGKVHFACAFAKLLLCEQPIASQLPELQAPVSCDHCRSCHLIKHGNHPDRIEITPALGSKAIKIEQIRLLCEQLSQTAHGGGYKVVLIFPANQLNQAAANALLKILEEPIGQTQFLLIADQLATIPATILSRCQRILLNSNNRSQAMSWLKAQLPDQDQKEIELLLTLADQAPLRAKQLADTHYLNGRNELLQHLLRIGQPCINPLSTIDSLKKWDESLLIFAFITIIMDLLRLRYSASKEVIYNQDWFSELAPLSQKFSVERGLTLLTSLNQLSEIRLKQVNVNWQLNLEQLLLQWEGLV